MNKLSILAMKAMRRIKLKYATWYNTTSFLSGLQSHGGNIHVGERIVLWNDQVSVGSNTNVYNNVVFWGSAPIKVGSNCEIGFNTIMHSSDAIEIGNNTSLAANCYIIDSNHGIGKDQLIRLQNKVIKGPVIIGEDV